jgi:GTPase SAR1 family protein
MKQKFPVIHIIGFPGAGKTTLANRLSRNLKIPVYCIGFYRARFVMTAIGEADAWLALYRDMSKHGVIAFWKPLV